MSDYFLEQIAELRRQVADLRKGRVTYRAATVTAANPGASTFDADVAGAGPLAGVSATPSFLPAVGDEVRLSLTGATPIYQPHRIGAGAVGDTEVGGLTAAKITAGTISADVLVAGQVATGTAGQRAGINSLGLFAYNSAGVKTVDLNGVSNLITGTTQSAPTGRRIVTGASGSTGEITFYPASGSQTSFVKSITESAGVEAVQLGLVSGQASDSSLWNRINFNSDEWTNLRSNKIDLNYLNGGLFVIRQLSSRNSSATATARMQIDASQTLMWAPDNATVYQLGNGAHTFYPASQSTSGWIKIRPNLISDSNYRTPYLEFATDNNGVTGAGAYTGVMKVTVRTGGTNPTFQFRNGDDTAWWGLEALSFVQSSSREFKTGISDYATEALPAILRTKVRRYLVANDPSERIGLIAEESPTEILGPDGNSIDLYQMIALLWKAVQELDETKVGRP